MSYQVDCIDKNEGKLIPRQRIGTQTFMDVPRELKEMDFQSNAGRYLMNILPEDVGRSFKRAIMETGIESEEALEWVSYALSEDRSGRPISPIARWIHENPYNPRTFKYIYREEDATTLLDYGLMITSGAYGIYLRLQSLIDHLPVVIREERKRFGLGSGKPYIIYNIGSAYSLDTIYAVSKDPELQDLVRIVCVDPDNESLNYGRKLAEKSGQRNCFEFIPKKVEEAGLDQAHMVLFIGMFCPVPTERCIPTLQLIKRHTIEQGLIIFSTVQEKMLMGGPILDFIMWSLGWRMFFKSNDEPGQIAKLAGYIHEKGMDWEDGLGFNRITVARRPG